MRFTQNCFQSLFFLMLVCSVAISQDSRPAVSPLTDPRTESLSPDVWRAERRLIDLHLHVENDLKKIHRAVNILDRVGIGVGVNLGAGTATSKNGKPTALQRAKELTDNSVPHRFLHHMLIDYSGWDDDDWSQKAAQQIEEGHRLGAAGLKEFKRLGLYLKDGKGKLIRIDDPKLDAVWQRCGELNMPVSIHVGDPKAFWLPYDENNERWTELKDHRSWWFGDPAVYPSRMELLDALDRVIGRHPKTTFLCVHFANNPEDLDWVDQALARRPNMYADLAARIPELGRQPTEKVRQLFVKYQDRILFATDFMVYNKLILGSGGDSENPTDDDAVTFYMKCFRWLETADRDWHHMTPIQGDWLISSINLPPEVLRKIYFDNARRIFARSLLPLVQATRINRDFVPDGALNEPEWKMATPCRLDYETRNSVARPHLSTPVRLLWSDEFLYLGFECPYKTIRAFEPSQQTERMGLWDNDVVEAFITPDPNYINRYTEFEWAPNGEVLDLRLDLPSKDFDWTAGADSVVSIDELAKIWRVETRIPLKSICDTQPSHGTKWRINFYRHDRSENAFLAFSPTLSGSFHTPARFGWLEFVQAEP